jgi:hypothetical protein
MQVLGERVESRTCAVGVSACRSQQQYDESKQFHVGFSLLIVQNASLRRSDLTVRTERSRATAQSECRAAEGLDFAPAALRSARTG